MNRDEYERMYRVEDRHWWFLARRDLLCRAMDRYMVTHSCAAPPRFLDVGCGTGGTMDRLAAGGATVCGLDVEPLALSLCRERGHRRLALGDASALPFPANAFEAVVALDVLEHVEADAAACREMVRVLAPGGLLILSVPAYRSLWSGHDIALMHRRRYVASEVRRLLEDAGGLHIERLTYIVSALLPLAWLVRRGQRLLRPNAPPRASTALPPSRLLNALLRRGMAAEAGLALRFPLPFGLSIFVVARKVKY